MEDLTMVYKGANTGHLYTAFYDGSKWRGDDRIAEQPGGISPRSTSSPATAVFNNWLYLVYKGVNTNTLYAAWYDGSKWNGNVRISSMRGGIAPESNYSPKIAVYKGLLYMVYKGANSSTLYMAWFDGTTWFGNKKIGDMPGGIEPKSTRNPSLVVFNNKLYIVYKGANTHTLYTACFDGKQWSGNIRIKGQSGGISPVSNDTPAAVSYKKKLYIIYKSPHNKTLFWAWYDGKRWAGDIRVQIQVSDLKPESTHSPRAGVYDDKLYIVYKGANTNTLYSAWFDSVYWRGNTRIKHQPGGISPESNRNPGISVSAITPTSNADWMRHLPDTVPLSEINIPGSHDAAAINTSIHTPYACHNHSIIQQLTYGIRLLDVRLQSSRIRTSYSFMTCHGDLGSSAGINTYQTFRSFLGECQFFLRNHSSETIIMSLKIDDWSNTDDKVAALKALEKLLYYFSVVSLKNMPELGDVRGKIVLLNRINNDITLGAPVRWHDNTNGSYASHDLTRDYAVYVQDRYQDLPTFGANGVKWDLVKKGFLKKKRNEVVLNFASATWYGVFGVYIMGELLAYFGSKSAAERLPTFGWTLFDYPFNFYHTDTYGPMNVVQLIIDSNTEPRYSAYSKKFKVSHEGHDDL